MLYIFYSFIQDVIVTICDRNKPHFSIYTMLFLYSSVIIGIIVGISSYVFVDKDCDNQFIQGCMAAGMSEEACKDKLY